MNTLASFEFTAFIGIDWADTKHDICIQPAGSEEREFDRIAHHPEQTSLGAYIPLYRLSRDLARKSHSKNQSGGRVYTRVFTHPRLRAYSKSIKPGGYFSRS